MADIDLEGMIEARHDNRNQWVTVRQLGNGTGWSNRGTIRYADVAAFSTWPSTGYYRVAYEIKRTRGDFLRELKEPAKRRWLETTFHETIFVCALDVCDKSEVPESWGLIVPTKKGDKLRRIVVAKVREPGPLPEYVAIAAMRRTYEQLQREHIKHYSFEGEEITRDDIDAKVKQLTDHEREWLKDEQKETRNERSALETIRENITAPLHTLRRLAKVRGWWRDNEPISAASVENWFRQAEAQATEKVRKQIAVAYGAITDLHDAMKTEEVDPCGK